MDDIKWERNITKELADTGGCFICSAARCSQPYQRRKNEDNAEHLEHTVHKYRLRTFHERNMKQNQQHNRTYPESSSNFHRFKTTRQQHTHRKRKQHTQQSAHEIDSIQCPAYTDTSITGGIRTSKHCQCDTQYHDHYRQCLGRKLMNKQCVEDIPDILEKQRPCRTVKREHLAISTHLISCTGHSRNKKHGTQKSHHY